MTKKKRKIYKNLIMLSCLLSGFLLLFSACRGTGSEKNLPEGKAPEDVREMGMGFQADWDVEPILTQKEGQEPEWYREWADSDETQSYMELERRGKPDEM